MVNKVMPTFKKLREKIELGLLSMSWILRKNGEVPIDVQREFEKRPDFGNVAMLDQDGFKVVIAYSYYKNSTKSLEDFIVRVAKKRGIIISDTNDQGFEDLVYSYYFLDCNEV